MAEVLFVKSKERQRERKEDHTMQRTNFASRRLEEQAARE
jgi:hypothetical protein